MYISKTIFLSKSSPRHNVSKVFHIVVILIGFSSLFLGLYISLYSRSIDNLYLYIALLVLAIVFLVIGFHILFSFFIYIFRRSTATTAGF